MTTETRRLEPSREIGRLVEIMAALRTPGTGCPWDLEQTLASIWPYTIEEAYEVADAIERGDRADLRDELGDLLLQVVYHAQLAAEEGAFTFGDVIHGITRKMIRRHPHVFGDERGATSASVKASWERIKADERAERSAERQRLGASRPIDASCLDGVPRALPSLTRANKLQQKAAAVGFDWPSLGPVFDKMREELGELEEVALISAQPTGEPARAEAGAMGSSVGEGTPLRDRARIEEEFGDLLFVMANVARHLAIDPETALARANDKFTRRFRTVETKLAALGKLPGDSTLAEMDGLWDEAKSEER